jgi:hypothetical protein
LRIPRDGPSQGAVLRIPRDGPIQGTNLRIDAA